MCWKLITISNLLTIRMRVDIFGTEKFKVTLALSILLNSLNEAEKDEKRGFVEHIVVFPQV